MTIGVNPRSIWGDWHEIAECFQHGNIDFALWDQLGNAGGEAKTNSKYTASDCQYRYPSPSKRPDPLRVRSCLSGPVRRRTADAAKSRRIHFLSPHNSVDSRLIRNLAGGRKKCGLRNISSDLRLLRHCRGVLKTIPNVAWRALRAVHSSPMSRVAMPLPARWSAGQQASSATTSTFASNGLIRAASTPIDPVFQTIGAIRTGGFFVVLTGEQPRLEEGKGQPCSKRS